MFQIRGVTVLGDLIILWIGISKFFLIPQFSVLRLGFIAILTFMFEVKMNRPLRVNLPLVSATDLSIIIIISTMYIHDQWWLKQLRPDWLLPWHLKGTNVERPSMVEFRFMFVYNWPCPPPPSYKFGEPIKKSMTMFTCKIAPGFSQWLLLTKYFRF